MLTDFGDDVNLARMSGTSMSSPHAAGVMALLLEQFGGALTPAQLRAAVVCAATGLAVSDAVAAAAGSPPLLLYSSPRGVAPGCAPVNAGMAARQVPPLGAVASAGASPPTVPASPASPASPGLPPAPTPALPATTSGVLSGGRFAAGPALALTTLLFAGAALLL